MDVNHIAYGNAFGKCHGKCKSEREKIGRGLKWRDESENGMDVGAVRCIDSSVYIKLNRGKGIYF